MSGIIHNISSTLRENGINPLVLLAGIPVVALLGICMCCGVVGLLGGGADNGNVGGGSDRNGVIGNNNDNDVVVAFIDDPENFRGQVLELRMTYMTKAVDGSYPPLRDRKGGLAKFSIYVVGTGASAEVVMRIPADINCPNIQFGDYAVVRFRCNDGDLEFGNVALEIRRP